MGESVEALRDMMSSLTDPEARAAINAIVAYRKKRNRPPGQAIGRFDDFLGSLEAHEQFTAQDVIDEGVSTSRAYARIKDALEAGHIELVRAGSPGMGRQQAVYRKRST